MSGETKIEWCDATWNVTAGCSKVSAGCANCWAERMAGRLGQRDLDRAIVSKGIDPSMFDSRGVYRWTGDVICRPEKLHLPLHWKKPRRIFVNSMSDLFHEKVPFGFIDKVFAIMALCPQHTFMVLTKRARRIREYFESLIPPSASGRGEACAEWLLSVFGWDVFERDVDKVSSFMRSRDDARPNVALGVSVEDQTTADERIPLLLATPSAHRFVSYEPAIGLADFSSCLKPTLIGRDGTRLQHPDPRVPYTGGTWEWGIDWMIMGCESGPNARPMNIEWARSVRDQCAAAHVPFFFKQAFVGGRLVKMPELDGVVHDAMPEVKR